MTFEDVKRIRENPTIEDVDNKELAKMIDIAIEKQIPKKPVIPWDSLDKNPIYPICLLGVFEVDSYCGKCGQALDWRKDE